MTPYTQASVQKAWQTLWQGGPFHVPSALDQGAAQGVPALLALKLTDMEPVPIAQTEATGPISLSFENVQLRNFSAASADSLQFDPASGKIEMQVTFRALLGLGLFAGSADAQPAGAAQVAFATLGAVPVAAADAPSQSQENLDQAKAYRTMLLAQDPTTQSGPQLVQQYYDHNGTFSELFQLSSVRVQWTTHTTNGQNSAFYAAHTASCAKSPDDNLNGTPDSEGNTPYNEHSFWQQTMVMNGCYAAQTYYQDTDPDKAARYGAAGDAAADMQTHALPPSQSPQTVNSVIALTKSTPPPPPAGGTQAGASAVLAAVANVRAAPPTQPAWLGNIHADGLRSRQAVHAELTLRDSLPQAQGDVLIQGTFSARFADVSAHVSATLAAGGSAQLVQMTAQVPSAAFSLQGDAVQASKPGNASPGASPLLRPMLERALARATPIHDVTRERVRIALESSQLGATLCSLLSAALQAQTP